MKNFFLSTLLPSQKVLRILNIFSLLFFLSCQKQSYWQPQELHLPLLQETNKQASQKFFSPQDFFQDKKLEVLFFNVFAINCSYCIKEIPDLNKFYQKYKENPKVKFIGVGSLLDAIGKDENYTYEDISDQMQEFIKKQKIFFPVYLAETKDFSALSTTGFPETFVLIRDKKNRFKLKRKFISVVTVEDLEAYVPMLSK